MVVTAQQQSNLRAFQSEMGVLATGATKQAPYTGADVYVYLKLDCVQEHH